MYSQSETMYNLTLHGENYTSFIVSLLIQKNGGRRGALFWGRGAYFKFWQIGGLLIRQRALIWGGVNVSRIYGNWFGFVYNTQLKTSLCWWFIACVLDFRNNQCEHFCRFTTLCCMIFMLVVLWDPTACAIFPNAKGDQF